MAGNGDPELDGFGRVDLDGELFKIGDEPLLDGSHSDTVSRR